MSKKRKPPQTGPILSKPPYDEGDEGLHRWASSVLDAIRQQAKEYDEFYGVTRDEQGHIVSQERYPEDVLEGEELRRALEWQHYCLIRRLQREFRTLHDCTPDNALGDLPDDETYRRELKQYVRQKELELERPSAREARLAFRQ